MFHLKVLLKCSWAATEACSYKTVQEKRRCYKQVTDIALQKCCQKSVEKADGIFVWFVGVPAYRSWWRVGFGRSGSLGIWWAKCVCFRWSCCNLGRSHGCYPWSSPLWWSWVPREECSCCQWRFLFRERSCGAFLCVRHGCPACDSPTVVLPSTAPASSSPSVGCPVSCRGRSTLRAVNIHCRVSTAIYPSTHKLWHGSDHQNLQHKLKVLSNTIQWEWIEVTYLMLACIGQRPLPLDHSFLLLLQLGLQVFHRPRVCTPTTLPPQHFSL
jgi:hypothetical protein